MRYPGGGWTRARLGAVLCVLAGAALGSPPAGLLAAAQAQEGATQSAPATSATVGECIASTTAADRSVTFTGQMETVLGAHRMAMEIVVQEHIPGEIGFHTLTVGGLGTWQRSEVGVKIYKYVRQVTDLPSPAAFRALVEYRWLNEKGRIIRSDERRTPICRQPEHSPAPPPAATTPTSGGAATTAGGDTTPAAATTSAATMPQA
jgi:hypothetical protein